MERELNSSTLVVDCHKGILSIFTLASFCSDAEVGRLSAEEAAPPSAWQVMALFVMLHATTTCALILTNQVVQTA